MTKKTLEDVYKTTDKKNRFSEDNKEILNPTPVAPPLGYKPSLSLTEQIRQQVRQLKHLDDLEPETEEEADDFDIEDDPIIESRWENDTIPSIKNMKAEAKKLKALEQRYAVPPAPQAAKPPSPPEAPEKE